MRGQLKISTKSIYLKTKMLLLSWIKHTKQTFYNLYYSWLSQELMKATLISINQWSNSVQWDLELSNLSMLWSIYFIPLKINSQDVCSISFKGETLIALTSSQKTQRITDSLKLDLSIINSRDNYFQLFLTSWKIITTVRLLINFAFKSWCSLRVFLILLTYQTCSAT